MAVAVKNSSETGHDKTGGTVKDRRINSLAISSIAGTVYVLASLAILFYGLPRLWRALVSPSLAGFAAVDRSLLGVALVVLALVLAYVGLKLAGRSQAVGVRAGIFTGVLGFLVTLLVVRVVGNVLEYYHVPQTAGLATVAILAAVMLGGLGFLYFRPGFGEFIETFDGQGWFSAEAYKRNQGVKVRRGTILGFLILAGCGVYTLLSHNVLVTAGVTHWQVEVPYTNGFTIRLLPDVIFTLPILLIAGSLWIGWRLVNYPPFADFLIATEAELNKVSWTTRKRLIQDTIIVLTTMLLLTTFLFTIDFGWAWILKKIQLVQPPEATQKRDEARW